MWTFFKSILARTKVLDAALGEVVFETPEVNGQSSRSFVKWRVKKGLDGEQYFVGLSMVADAAIGTQGSMTNYMNFDIESAQRLRFQLDRCIAEYQALTRTKPSEITSSAG